MMKAILKIAGLAIVMAFLTHAGVSFADENEVVELKGLVSDLTKKVSSLEHKVTTMEGHIEPAQKTQGFVAQTPAEQPGGLIHTIQDMHMGGYLDVQFNQNLNHTSSNTFDPSTLSGGNPLRVFDSSQNTFTVNNAELDFSKPANPDGGAGFRLDLMMGEDARIVDFDPSTDQDEFAIQQAFVEVVTPFNFWKESEILPHSAKTIAGRFVTLAGAEVIESADNWNISRSLGFGWAIPFTHTGIRTEMKFWKDFFDVYFGVNNGWDNVVDNNEYKTVETGLGFSPIKDVSIFSSFYFGPENNRQKGHKRYMMSNVVKWNATDKLSFMADIDFGTQRRVRHDDIDPNCTDVEDESGSCPDIGVFRNSTWADYAGYVRYQFTSKFAMAYRIELFRDDTRFRLVPGAESVWEQTLTAEFKPYENLIARAEYRFDKENDGTIFNGDSNQNTLGAELIYLI